jgi:hypothetical protein
MIESIGRLDPLVQECGILDNVEQIMGETSNENFCLFGGKSTVEFHVFALIQCYPVRRMVQDFGKFGAVLTTLTILFQRLFPP